MGQIGKQGRTERLRNENFRGVVGYVKLPATTGVKTTAAYNKATSNSARQGMREVLTRYNRLLRNINQYTPDMLRFALQSTFDFSRIYCPEATGALVNSGKLFVEKHTTGHRAWITYGDNGRISYAAIVHERTDVQHAAPTRSKYLQAALEDTLPLIKPRLQEALVKFTGAGKTS